MDHVLSDMVCIRMYRCQNWQIVRILLFPVANPPLSPNFKPYFLFYLNAIFFMFVGYDVRYYVLNHHAKTTSLRD